jgi:hypothetical protein
MAAVAIRRNLVEIIDRRSMVPQRQILVALQHRGGRDDSKRAWGVNALFNHRC